MKTPLFALIFVLTSMAALAETHPINLSLTPEVALHDRDDRIEGISLSIWGENPQDALAIGFINGATRESNGLSIGLINYADTYRGVQWGLLNYTSGDMNGWQGGFLFGIVGSAMNCTGGTMSGFQCGLLNYAGTLSGLQVGLINFADRGDGGVQIGLFNIIDGNEVWFHNLPEEVAPAMFIANWQF